MVGQKARDNGLKYSLLERLCKLYKSLGGAALDYVVQLDNNYRCHAEIMRIPNELFYNNICKCPENVQAHPMAPYPLIFICSSLDYKVDPELESKVLLDKLQNLIIKNWSAEQKRPKQSDDLALITTSRPQVMHT